MKVKIGRIAIGLIGTSVFLGCGDKNSDTGEVNQQQSCADRSIDTCASTDDCRIVGAGAMGQTAEGELCIDMNAEAEELGCIDVGPCDDAETYARAPDSDTCYFFADTCIPEGWLPCAVGGVNECVQ